MKYACYTCGEKLGKGIPPLHALSSAQSEIVGNINVLTVNLVGTKFEGMSPASFCEVCLLLIQVDGGEFTEKVDVPLYVSELKDELRKENPLKDELEIRAMIDWTMASRKAWVNYLIQEFPDRKEVQMAKELICTHSDSDYYLDPVSDEVGMEFCLDCGATSHDLTW